jgi:hypothetical protein
MEHPIRLLAAMAAVAMSVAVLSCAGTQPEQPPVTMVPISSFHQVAGKWAGLLKAMPRSKQDDWVTLTLQEDGTYSFTSVRTIGIFHGQGTLALADGKMMTITDRGRAACVLHEGPGRRILKIEAATNDGVEYSADLTPER